METLPTSSLHIPTHEAVRGLAPRLDATALSWYREAIASILALPLDHRLCQEYRAGIAAILHCLREGKTAVLERIHAHADLRLQRFILGSIITEEWWQTCEKSIPAFLASREDTAVPRFTETQYHAQVSFSERETEEFLKKTINDYAPGTSPPLGHDLPDAQENLLFSTPFSSIHGHLHAGVHTANFYAWDLLRILPDVYAEYRGNALREEHRQDIVRVAESIPHLLAVLARLHISTFVATMYASAGTGEDPRLPHSSANVHQCPAYFFIRETPNTLSLELDPTALREVCGPIDPGIGCPASYARDSSGKDVITSFFRNVILPLWERHCLPHLFPRSLKHSSVSTALRS